jgi:hypothetical protein
MTSLPHPVLPLPSLPPFLHALPATPASFFPTPVVMFGSAVVESGKASDSIEGAVPITSIAAHSRLPLIALGFADGTVRLVWVSPNEKAVVEVRVLDLDVFFLPFLPPTPAWLAPPPPPRSSRRTGLDWIGAVPCFSPCISPSVD